MTPALPAAGALVRSLLIVGVLVVLITGGTG
jgi:hypothetical protein